MSVSVSDVNTKVQSLLTIPAFESAPGQTQLGVTSVTGDPITDESILSKTITFANGAHCDVKQWFNETTSFDDYVTRVTTHAKGPKMAPAQSPASWSSTTAKRTRSLVSM